MGTRRAPGHPVEAGGAGLYNPHARQRAGDGMEEARRFVISGLVQGVGFRYYVFKRARERGVVGYVRNLSDGRVEVVAQGSAEALSALRDDLEVGSSFSKVQRVEETPVAEANLYKTFMIDH